MNWGFNNPPNFHPLLCVGCNKCLAFQPPLLAWRDRFHLLQGRDIFHLLGSKQKPFVDLVTVFLSRVAVCSGPEETHEFVPVNFGGED